jgi:hypothetical protein
MKDYVLENETEKSKECMDMVRWLRSIGYKEKFIEYAVSLYWLGEFALRETIHSQTSLLTACIEKQCDAGSFYGDE